MTTTCDIIVSYDQKCFMFWVPDQKWTNLRLVFWSWQCYSCASPRRRGSLWQSCTGRTLTLEWCVYWRLNFFSHLWSRFSGWSSFGELDWGGHWAASCRGWPQFEDGSRHRCSKCARTHGDETNLNPATNILLIF